MQHTEKYKFNLIETSDTFSPDALNANARTAEAQLAALAATDAALASTDAANKTALEQALASQKTALEQTITANKTALEQSISSTKTALEKTITTNKTAADAAIKALNADVHPGAFGQIARIATGTYVGKGVNGSNSPSTLSFDFKPILLFINSANDNISLIMMRPGTSSYYGYYSPNGVSWGEKSVSWAAYYPNYQCNVQDQTYNYIAIGVPV